ncbi:MAG: hypothetical protein HFH91_09890 [Lachnospiraceae bacterium]|nr:hypothetical protein [Lachnospiraceae bacterium]
MNEERDCLIIETEFLKGIISAVVHKVLEKKGLNTDVQLYDFAVEYREEKLHIHLNAEASINTEDLKKLLKNNGWYDEFKE